MEDLLIVTAGEGQQWHEPFLISEEALEYEEEAIFPGDIIMPLNDLIRIL